MELNYIVKRSPNRKKLTIIVERDCSVVVHAPESTSEEKIQIIVESKRNWIYEKDQTCAKVCITTSAGQRAGQRRIRTLSRPSISDRSNPQQLGRDSFRAPFSDPSQAFY